MKANAQQKCAHVRAHTNIHTQTHTRTHTHTDLYYGVTKKLMLIFITP